MVGQSENADFTLRPVRASGDDVRQQHRQAAIVINPPDVDGALRLLCVEEIHRLLDVSGNRSSAASRVVDFVERDLLLFAQLLLVRQGS